MSLFISNQMLGFVEEMGFLNICLLDCDPARLQKDLLGFIEARVAATKRWSGVCRTELMQVMQSRKNWVLILGMLGVSSGHL